MEFRIADTFTTSLARLSGDEQKSVKLTTFDLQVDPSSPGHQFHKVDRAKDKNFWSVRVSRDLRIIVHRTASSFLLCYAGHHDDAYAWAARRRLDVHPTTGAAQIVEIRETVIEIPVERYVEVEAVTALQLPKPPLFRGRSEDELLGYGVPPEWLHDVLQANEDTLLDLAIHLPAEAGEALLELALGGTPKRIEPVQPSTDPFAHPDAQRRFRTVENVDELTMALDFPWEKWTIYLHPSQRAIVERRFNGPARVAGSAGTGKTVVALHRAVHLAKQYPGSRILLTTFSDQLAHLLETKLHLLVMSQPSLAEQIEVASMKQVALRLYRAQFDEIKLADDEALSRILRDSLANHPDLKFPYRFVATEWRDVVDAWQLKGWEDFRDIRRLGRRSRLTEPHRATLWPVFAETLERLEADGLTTTAQMFQLLAEGLPARSNPPYDFAIIDEAQDVSITQLRFLAALGSGRPDALFFAGDLGQRIFQQPFSWLGQGVDVRGRSSTLRVNYRTSHQIRSRADQLLGAEIVDLDGVVEERKGTVSIFNGPVPEVISCNGESEERQIVGQWIKDRVSSGVASKEIAVIVRSGAQVDHAKQAIGAAGLTYRPLTGPGGGEVSVGTMHDAKGLEFRAVVVMACDDEVIPLQERIETAADPSELEEAYNTERHLLYVACTRAREHLLLTSGGPPSEFLNDISSL